MSEFDGIALVTLNTWLSEAQTALHELSVGKKTVSVSMGDKRVSFGLAEVRQLRAYIGRLQIELAIRAGGSAATPYSVATWER